MEFKKLLKSALILPTGLFLVLAAFSYLIGWNLITLLLFWFVLIPVATIHLPKVFSKRMNQLPESLLGLSIFYGFMVFMIYDHFQTDYFRIMMISGVINLFIVTIILYPGYAKSKE